jgi:O-antigen/teichoic acid export membrane protein
MLKKLAGQTALYGLSSMLGRALNFLLVPFYTSVLAVGDFGIFTEFYAYVAFFNIVYLFGMETTYFRYANKGEESEKEIFRTTQSFVLAVTVILSTLLLSFAVPLSSLLKYPGQEKYIYWLVLVMSVDALAAIPFARLRQKGKAGFFAFAKLTTIGLTIGLNIFFLVVCKKIYEGELLPSFQPVVASFYSPSRAIEFVFISNFIANLAALLFLYAQLTDYRWRWSIQKIKPMFTYALPLMVMGLAGQVNEVLDRILFKPLLPVGFYDGITSEEALGIYGGCYKLSMFMTLAIQSFRYAADPFFFSKAADKNAPAVFASVMSWFVAICAGIFLTVSLFSPLLASILLRDPLYQQGLMVVPVLLLANLFLGIYYNLSVWYKLTDRTYWGTWIGLGGASLTIIGNVLLIPWLGYMGAAVTTLVCYVVMTIVSYQMGEKYFSVPYQTSSIFLLIGMAILLLVMVYKLPVNGFWLKQLTCAGAIAIYGLFVWVLKKYRFLGVVKK